MLADGKLAYAINSGAWGLVGIVGTLLVSYLLGRKARVKDPTAPRFTTPQHGTMTLIAAVCIPLIGIAFTVAQQARQSSVNDCQTRINGQNAQALIARSQANAQDAQLQLQADTIIDNLITKIGQDLTTQDVASVTADIAEAQQLRADIAADRAELVKQRAANPYADPISECS